MPAHSAPDSIQEASLADPRALILNEGKLLLLCKTRLEGDLRVDAIHDCLDGDEDLGDYFTKKLTTTVGHPLGEEHFSKKTFACLYGPDYSPKCLASSDDWSSNFLGFVRLSF